MAVPLPKIVYGLVTLNFTLPPIGKPGEDDEQAERNDAISLSGLKQTVHWRTDIFHNLQMDWVPLADMPAWKDFISYALAGGEFSYYPDATLAGFTVYTLEDTKWSPTRNIIGISKFTLKFRKVVGPDQTGS